MQISTLISSSVFQENTYLVIKNRECIIIDPGEEPERITEEIRALELVPLAVLATHGHPDHILSAKPLCSTYTIKFYMDSRDMSWLEQFSRYVSHFRLNDHGTVSFAAEQDLKDQEFIQIGPFNIQIFFTPGHSAGSVCFLIDNILFSGDTLFHQGVGRTDLPGGNAMELQVSIEKTLYSLPDEIVVYPGHMDKTTIGYEKKNNYYIKD